MLVHFGALCSCDWNFASTVECTQNNVKVVSSRLSQQDKGPRKNSSSVVFSSSRNQVLEFLYKCSVLAIHPLVDGQHYKQTLQMRSIFCFLLSTSNTNFFEFLLLVDLIIKRQMIVFTVVMHKTFSTCSASSNQQNTSNFYLSTNSITSLLYFRIRTVLFQTMCPLELNRQFWLAKKIKMNLRSAFNQ